MAGILLVHGAWHGPWCWDGFAERLRRRGHRVEAVRLRGHDRPPGRIWHRVHHYVQDVREAAAGCAEPPVLVGHSLGALVVQRYLERGPARAGVLLAPIPPGGTVAAVGRIAVRHPLILAKATLFLSLRPFIGSSALVREWFFTPDTPDEVVGHCMVRLQDESYPAFLETLVVLPRPRRVHVPVLVMGAERDPFFTVGEVRRSARAYRTEAEIVPGMGHDLMLDQGWENVADRIDSWIRETLDRPVTELPAPPAGRCAPCVPNSLSEEEEGK
jgi:pimeloyl-ACP methyl ester carboxylesterase